MKQEKRWLLMETDEQIVRQLAADLQIPPVIAGMLVRRGVTDREAAKRFLEPDKSHFYDPFLMKDMAKAVSRIRRAMVNNEHIMVYGDYDADGATSTSVMYLALKKLGAQVAYYIPDRFEEGYGLNGPALVQAKERGFQLVITVDNGISSVEEARIANELGLDLIVTDHHTPPEVLPDAYAILNPKQPGCPYPDKMLAGVGIAFKLAQALFGELPEEFLDLAAIGTIADLTPLIDENRLLARYGLERINKSPRVGIKALIEIAGLGGKEITAGHVGFAFGPRINAAGRLDSATFAVELLTADDWDRGMELARFLDERNRERQDISAQMFEEAVQEIELHPEWLDGRVLVIAREGWNAGVIGIVASRLVERYYRPTLMISLTEGMGKGSARSIHGFHLYDAMNGCRDLFEHFGGHKMAAGFSISGDRIEELRERLNQIAEAALSPDDLIPKIEIEADLDLLSLDFEFVERVSRLAPFGFGNPIPRFRLRGLGLDSCRTVGADGAHLQVQVSTGAAKLAGIAFRKGPEAELIRQWQRLDLVGELAINEWNGRRSLQIILEDWRPNEQQVFDCRHVQHKVSWLGEQAGAKDLSVVCFHEEVVSEVTRALAPYPWQEPHFHRVLLADGKGNLSQVALVGEEAKEAEERSASAGQRPETLLGDIVFYDLPQSMDQYRAVLQQLKGPFRLYLLHGSVDKQWIGRKTSCWLPDRKLFAGVYKMLQESPMTDSEIRQRLKPAYHEALDLILSVFVELGFAVRNGVAYHVNKGTNKRALEESELYQKRKHRIDSYVRVIAALIDSSSEQTVREVMRLVTANPEGANSDGFEEQDSRDSRFSGAGNSV
ncbi:single-stranded-DNA-specific exonuclease RecJ [Effusibacillus lacus]|uniref:Single-stranded-DNA-specific exonuclease RecJ n=1 Tax=Effusibacillus lacus TaxID=1348429 RepID=A0A292YRC0_9BACL|nr:single-stranded-DNA-specific exonuclease RecJ [Effusibacillus lacus]TCS68974.1 exonuclease RecJ [Effusibacillus lacus]GAX91461.1 single-stranded-DNA-specific exonuclease RecJ [Effusibacillus lacus]